MPFLLIALVGILFLATIFLAPKPQIENARASTLDDLNFPVAKEGSAIPWMIGKVRHRGPNVIWYGDFAAVAIRKKIKTGLFSSKRVTTGYKYYIGMDMGLCMGPNVTLLKIWSDKDVVWTGTANNDLGTAIAINKPDLYGGTSDTAGGGGGLVGTFTYYPGGFLQSVNPYMVSKVPGGVYNRLTGQAHLVAEHIYIGTAPNLRPFNFELSRYPNTLGIAGGKEIIGEDANPAEALYQILTAKWGALGVDVADINIASFLAAADTLFTEGSGVSMLITKSAGSKTVIEEVLRLVDGIMYQDPATGTIMFKLIRNDYNILTLPRLTPSNVLSMRNFSRTSWDDTLNQIRVGYTNRANDYNTGMALQQDMANINSQGQVRSADYSYPLVSNGTVAQFICSRELARMSVPLFKATLEVNRAGADLRPGMPFILDWPEYGLASVVMRVQRLDLGELLAGKMVIEALQDTFAVNKTVFVAPGTTTWTPITKQPATAAATRIIHESHYFFFKSAAITGNIAGPGSGIIVAAAAPDASAQYAEVNVSKDAGATYAVALAQYHFTPVGALQTAITATANLATGKIPALTVSGFLAADLPVYSASEQDAGACMLLIGNEYFVYEGVTVSGANFILSNVRRAMLDSAPLAHSIGDAVAILSGDNVVEEFYAGTAALRVKLLTKSVNASLDIAAAPYDSLTLENRVYRPGCPANVKFNGGTAFNGPVDPTLAQTITWANRSRLSAVCRTLVDATSENEIGQQTVIRYRVAAGAWVSQTFGPGITTATITTGATGVQAVDFEIYSSRDAVDSYNKWTFSGVGGGTVASSGGGTSPTAPGGTPPADGTTPAVAGNDPVSLVFPFGMTIGTDPIDLPITFPITIPANLSGINIDNRTNPAAPATFTLKKGGTTVGTIAISSVGAYTITAAAISLVSGDTLSCYPPASPDVNLQGVTITVAGIKG